MALIKCPSCGKDVSNKARHCPGCGAGINVSICPDCGAELPIGVDACMNCGCPVEFSSSIVSPLDSHCNDSATLEKPSIHPTTEKTNPKANKRNTIIAITIVVLAIVGIIVALSGFWGGGNKLAYPKDRPHNERLNDNQLNWVDVIVRSSIDWYNDTRVGSSVSLDEIPPSSISGANKLLISSNAPDSEVIPVNTIYAKMAVLALTSPYDETTNSITVTQETMDDIKQAIEAAIAYYYN